VQKAFTTENAEEEDSACTVAQTVNFLVGGEDFFFARHSSRSGGSLVTRGEFGCGYAALRPLWWSLSGVAQRLCKSVSEFYPYG
jgi:hypothetical protein